MKKKPEQHHGKTEKDTKHIFSEINQNTKNEINISKTLKHPFLVNMVHAFETEQFYCLVYEYCPGGELFYLLKNIKIMTESEARFYFIQILYGMEYLHQKNIIYRDLKPENVLLDHDGNIKIADFGLSKTLTHHKDRTYSYCGSTEYMAP